MDDGWSSWVLTMLGLWSRELYIVYRKQLKIKAEYKNSTKDDNEADIIHKMTEQKLTICLLFIISFLRKTDSCQKQSFLTQLINTRCGMYFHCPTFYSLTPFSAFQCAGIVQFTFNILFQTSDLSSCNIFMKIASLSRMLIIS